MSIGKYILEYRLFNERMYNYNKNVKQPNCKDYEKLPKKWITFKYEDTS